MQPINETDIRPNNFAFKQEISSFYGRVVSTIYTKLNSLISKIKEIFNSSIQAINNIINRDEIKKQKDIDIILACFWEVKDKINCADSSELVISIMEKFIAQRKEWQLKEIGKRKLSYIGEHFSVSIDLSYKYYVSVHNRLKNLKSEENLIKETDMEYIQKSVESYEVALRGSHDSIVSNFDSSIISLSFCRFNKDFDKLLKLSSNFK